MNSTDFNWGDNIINSRDIINYYEERLDEKESYESIIEEAEERLEVAEEEYRASRVIYERDDDELERYVRLEHIYIECSEDLENAKKDLRDAFDHDEFKLLEDIISQGESYSDWNHGATLINDNHFTDHIKDLIEDSYPTPTEMNSWPWNNAEMNWESAADEVRSDYGSIDADGQTYYIQG